MKRADAALERIYERDPTTNAFIIAAAINRYTDIFNELDPAPFKRRDLNYNLRIFLEDCSADIPLKYDIILQFNIADEVPDATKEEKIKSGLKTYFSFVGDLLTAEIKKSYQKSTMYVIIAFFLLSTAYSLRTVTTDDIVFRTLVEGINIGGWVFLWEAISTFMFRKRDTKNKNKHYKRFSNTQIRFNYTPKTPNA